MRRVFRSRKPGNSKQVFSECRIMNYLQTSFARVAQGNIGPRYFLDGPLFARSYCLDFKSIFLSTALTLV